MKILVISHIQLDSNFANSINTFKMADGFSKSKNDVTLICRKPYQKKFTKKKIFENLNINKDIKIILKKNIFATFSFSKNIIFPILCLKDLILIKPDFVYCRNYVIAIICTILKIPVFSEVHAHTNNKSFFLKKMIYMQKKNILFIVTISSILKKYYVDLGGEKKKILVLKDGADIELFKYQKKKIINKNFTVTYSGSLTPDKGIELIFSAAKVLIDINFILIGAKNKQKKNLNKILKDKKIKNVKILNYMPHSKIPIYLSKSDVLALTHDKNYPASKWTSPMKLGEYLSTGVPIISADIPAIKKLVSKKSVKFYKSNNLESFVNAIKEIKKNANLKKKLSINAIEESEQFSFMHRCKEIVKFYKKNMKYK